jgi:DNA-binding XRE family transcriptional regulator
MKCNTRCAKNTRNFPHLKFKGYLVENKIRQTEIAKLLQLSPVTVNQKINGSLCFTFPEVELICDTYGISPNIFLTKKLHNDNIIAQEAFRIC